MAQRRQTRREERVDLTQRGGHSGRRLGSARRIRQHHGHDRFATDVTHGLREPAGDSTPFRVHHDQYVIAVPDAEAPLHDLFVAPIQLLGIDRAVGTES